ncbi:hypothetical protein E2C01_093501 [Portunus trituberculatus]|uniref:Uncharacterized protein n=1 Tax=Portunus trituberculatus TaxID=210409 RepID=A0A5B7JYW3_PORTR|nr:hypothetical protein [Portunus trituberculatus]
MHWRKRCFAAPSTEKSDPASHQLFPDNTWCHPGRDDTLPRCTFHGRIEPCLAPTLPIQNVVPSREGGNACLAAPSTEESDPASH